MPSETRSIVFSYDELLEALREFSEFSAKHISFKRIGECKVAGKGGVAVTATLRAKSGEAPAEIPISTSDVGAALLRYCFSHRVPIPRRAEKSLRIVGDNVALVLTLNSPTFRDL